MTIWYWYLIQIRSILQPFQNPGKRPFYGMPINWFLTHMSRIKLLQSSEVKVFDAPPVFSYEHRLQFFGTDELIQTELGKLRTPYSKLGFLIQLGYFKWTGRFFEVGHFRGKDIEHLIKKLELPITSFDFQTQYSKQLAYYHRPNFRIMPMEII